ncbi:Acyltransferase 3 [Planktothrix serta PCC 8927]|uniref:Acyltransferase 3 n=1 Tax=Planktothrix serta PCC 8927 TaxID=671068 RepID=A0A7Z9BXQ8_9CYAN|nr:acyltransferase [Planktothrix serta]VXD24687.1 Acyltransferase 3 [Planktothrix serta PCC 8927]
MSSTVNPPQKQRLDWIDQTKGLAILGILFFHFFQNYPDKLHLVSLLDRNGAKIGYAAVDIFFVMAGFNTSYILAAAAQKYHLPEITTNWKSWLLKRLDRIYPTYFIAVVCSLFLYFIFGHEYPIKSPLGFILSCLGLAGYQWQSINPGFWFFTVILELYLLTPLIFLGCKSKPKSILILGIIVGVIAKIFGFYLLVIQSKWFGFFLGNNIFLSYFFQYCVGLYWGIIYYQNQNRFRLQDFTRSVLAFGIGLIFYLYLALTKVDIVYMLGFDILFTPLMFLGCYRLFQGLNRYKGNLFYGLSLLSGMGIYSYQIYLIHQPLFFVILPVFNRFLSLNPYLKIIISIIGISILLSIYLMGFIRLEQWIRKTIQKQFKPSF